MANAYAGDAPFYNGDEPDPDRPGGLQEEAEADWWYEEEAYCPTCGGGVHKPLGSLGLLMYWRCADCGAEWSEQMPVKDMARAMVERDAATEAFDAWGC